MLSITVNTLNDELDGSILDGDVSLRDALLAATPFETINFDPALTAGGPNTLNLHLGELRITKDVIIQGPGSSLLTIDATGNDLTPTLDNGDGSRIFSINNGSGFTNIDVKINGLTLTGGDALLDGGAIRNFENLATTDLIVTGNASHRDGGGIWSSGSLTLINSTISGNIATRSGGGVFTSNPYLTVQTSNISYNSALNGGGGGIASSAAGNYLTIADSVINGNFASGSGGGVLEANGSLRISGSTISSNRASLAGGGIDSTATNLVISNTSVNYNHAYSGNGGGLRTDISPATITGSSFFNNNANGSGGGIWSNGGTLTLVDLTLSGNSSFVKGGGIFADGVDTVISHSTLSNDNAFNSGGGISTHAGSLDITDTTISNGATSGDGGGIFADETHVNIARTTISNGFATDGGGIWIHAGTLAIAESTISGNRASADGGGILSNLATLSLLSSTISGNSAVNDGGGLWLNAGVGPAVSIRHSTITQNTARLYGSGFGAGGGIITSGATVVDLNHTILAENFRGVTHDDLFGKAYSTYSLIGVDTGALLVDNGGSLIGTAAIPINPLLAPLAPNGGSTQTHLPQLGSPVLDAGDPLATADGSVPLFDQRGVPFSRIQLGHLGGTPRIDIGAVEVQPGSIHGQKWEDINSNGVKDPGEPGLAGWTVFLDQNRNGIFDNDHLDIPSADVPKPIFDYSSTTSQIVVNGFGAIDDLNLSFNISHTFDGDLRAFLTSPSGTRVTLFSGVGGGGDNFNNTILDDQAATPIGSGFAPFLGSYRPAEPLASFSGQNANGVWTLEIDDVAGGDTGVLNGWSMSFSSGETSTTTDADGNYTFLDLPPDVYSIGEVQQPGWEQTSPTALSATLDQITSNNAAISALVPNRYDFFEGDFGNSINDGGDDMYDGGNFLNTNLGTGIAYTNGVVTPGDTVFGPGSQYFTAKYPGLFVMGATGISINYFQITGNNGADGSGSVYGETLSTTVNGQQYTIYVKRVYNAGDPSINHIIMVPGDGAGISHGFSSDTDNDLDAVSGLSSTDEIYYALVARQSGQFLSSADILNIANEFLTNISNGPTGHTVTVHSGEFVTGVDFGNHGLPGSIHGQKWNDLNGNGLKEPGEPGLDGWTIYLDRNHNGVLDTGIQSTYQSLDVPKTASLSTVFSQLQIDAPGTLIQDIDVTLDISHTWDNDAQVFLISPAGTRVQLFVGVGSSGDNFTNTTLDDEATITITRAGAPFTGHFRPQQPLSTFDGETLSGVWTLEFTDIFPSDSGTLNSWSLSVLSSEPTAITDANGNYAFLGLPYGPYSVGEILPKGWKQTYPALPANTGLIVNGGFETGNFAGWTLEDTGAGSFVINNGTYDPSSPDGPLPPYNGAYSALSDPFGPGVCAIYQDLTVPTSGHYTLQWADRIHNHNGLFEDPNQEFRVEIRDTANHLLATVFSTNPGDVALQNWTLRSVDLTPFAGQTIRIAFVEQASLFYLNVDIDNVQIIDANSFGPIPVTIQPGQNLSNVDFGNQLLLPGDYNLNGVVDAADYTTWADSRGHSAFKYRDADGNGNGIIDGDDYFIWVQHFGQTLPPAGGGAIASYVAAESPAAEQRPALLQQVVAAQSASSTFSDAKPIKTYNAAAREAEPAKTFAATSLPFSTFQLSRSDDATPRLARSALSYAQRHDDLLAAWQSTLRPAPSPSPIEAISPYHNDDSYDKSLLAIDDAFALLELDLQR